MSATDDLIKQILASSNTSKWTGEGFGSAEKNAADMANILSKAGITDIKQLGIKKEVIPAMAGEWGETPEQTVNKYYNKETGQELENTYGERQTGDFFGGTFSGKGNTGYGVQFRPDGTPVFYTQGASSNDVAKIMEMAGPVGQIAVGALGGPVAVAALAAASGKPIGDIVKSAALSYLGGQAGNMVSGASGVTDVLGKAGTDALAGAAKQYVASGGKADPLQLLMGAGLTYGANSLGSELGFDKLTPAQQNMLKAGLSGAVAGQPLDRLLMNVAMSGAMTKDNPVSNLGPGTKEEFESGLIPGYFLPGGAGYTEKQVTNPLGPTEEFDPSAIDWEALYKEGMSDEDIAKREELMKLGGQEMQIDPNMWKEYNDNLIDIVNNKGGYTSQWQTVGNDRIMIQDDGTAIATNENGDSYSLNEDEVNSMIKNGMLNTEASGYNDAIGKTKLTTPATQPKTTKPTTPTTQNPLSPFAGLQQQQGPILPSQDPFAHIKLMEELFGTDIDLTPTEGSDNTTGEDAE
jgi:hypothetical protein